MATERNVVDFKIHNLTEEQFQELKAQGQIDPNAVYCTPDTTKERLDALETKTTSLEENKQDKGDYATNAVLSAGLLQKQDVATALNYKNISNCITEIPQDIKLEVSGNTITLKAGSVYYVPNGVGVFDKKTVASDISRTYTGTGTSIRIVLINNGGAIDTPNALSVYSGDTDPEVGSVYWYDTATNVVNAKSSATSNAPGCSLALGVITVTDGAITSIDQVFNGFGYMGSTVFALPGVKGLIPNGRNEDGSLNNIQTTVNNVITYTTTDNATGNYYTQLGTNYVARANQDFWKYNEQKNIVLRENNIDNKILCCPFRMENGVIKTMNMQTTFHAVDYADIKYILSSSGNGLATFSKGANGYYKFSNGLIIQWGLVSNANASTPFSYPIPFTGDFALVGSGRSSSDRIPTFFDVTTTGAKIKMYGGPANVTWIAIGY